MNDKTIMSQTNSQFRLMSPQALQQAAYQQPAPGSRGFASVSEPVQQPGAQFSRVSNLLTPDQLQTHAAANASSSLLADPIALFGGSTTVSPVQAVIQPGSPAVNGPNAIIPSSRPSLPALNLADIRHRSGVLNLEAMKPETLKQLGAQDKEAFFEALLPAAIESEKKFGVPAELTLAQAALESAWARSPIGGYNIFGVKGTGPAGKTSVNTREFLNGKWVQLKDGFAKYHNFNQAVVKHGELFHNGYYDKAVNQYSRDQNVYAFIDNIQGIYATDPQYDRKIKSIIEDYGLEQMVRKTGMV